MRLDARVSPVDVVSVGGPFNIASDTTTKARSPRARSGSTAIVEYSVSFASLSYERSADLIPHGCLSSTRR